MSSAMASRAIEELISAIELCRETQNEIDNLYSNLTHKIINEMESAVPKYNPSPQTNKRFKSKKPFWNDNLQLKWEILREKEKLFLNCRGNKNMRARKRHEYNCARDSFDKLLRQSERSYRRTVASEIENMATNNPNEFWSKIKTLGPRKSTEIPMEVIDDDGSVSSNPERVFDVW